MAAADASSGAAQSVTATMSSKWEDSLLEEGLQCSICMQFFCAPVKLTCKHAFCRLCILQATKLSPDGRCCPECRADIDVENLMGHPADDELAARVKALVPANMLEARTEADSKFLSNYQANKTQTLPVFHYEEASLRPGRPVSLTLNDVMYRDAIKESWEGNRRIVLAQDLPKEGDSGLVVHMGSLVFTTAGKTEITGRGLEVVKLRKTWPAEETSTHLFWSEVDGAVAKGYEARLGGAEGIVEESVEANVQRALQEALRDARSDIDAGSLESCIALFRAVADNALRELIPDCAMASMLRSSIWEADAERRSREYATYRNHGLAQDSGRDPLAQQAMRSLRQAFEKACQLSEEQAAGKMALPQSLELDHAAFEDGLTPPAPSDWGCEETGVAPPPRGAMRKLGIFLTIPQAHAGDQLSIDMEEPHWRILAREAWERNDRYFLFASKIPEPNSTAVLMLLRSHVFDTGQGKSHISSIALEEVVLDSVSRDSSKGGIFYGTCRSLRFGVDRGGKCCVAQ